MKVTNNYNLPEAIYRAVNKDYEPNPRRLSVTELIDPPLIKQLKIKHWQELTEDASERLWRLLGQAMDYILTQNAPVSWIVQNKIELPIQDGYVVVGRIDYYDTITQILGDWKVTSAWSYVLGGRAEWEKQLNLYAYLVTIVRQLEVKGLVAQRLFRDHTASKTYDPDYPPIPFMSLNLPLWPVSQQKAYLDSRIALHLAEAKECSPEEKWQTKDTYAVMKSGRKSALRVLDSNAMAIDWLQQNKPEGKLSVELRKGECKRCIAYCAVRAVCPYVKGDPK